MMVSDSEATEPFKYRMVAESHGAKNTKFNGECDCNVSRIRTRTFHPRSKGTINTHNTNTSSKVKGNDKTHIRTQVLITQISRRIIITKNKNKLS